MFKKMMWVVIGLLCLILIFGGLFLGGKADWLIYVFYHPALTNNPEATAVSYAELEEFVRGYSTADYPEEWNCDEFATAFHNSAEAMDIKTAIVVSRVGTGFLKYHVFNAIITIDKGIIYIDSMVGRAFDKTAIATLSDGIYRAIIEAEGHRTSQMLGGENKFIIIW
jgi:hypothetical protein